MAEAKRICSVPECGKPHVGKGLCSSHYSRLRKKGIIGGGPFRAGKGEPRRFLDAHLGFSGDECVIWPFKTDRGGYGALRSEGSFRTASNVMCREAHGDPLNSRFQAAHSCRNPPCINPRHLSWKMPIGNAADRVLHGTNKPRAGQRRPKLTACDVRFIRANVENLTIKEMADRFSVSSKTVSRVVKLISWPDLT